MDDQRWETAALRESRARYSDRPGVSQDRRRRAPSQPAVWVTLREASDATGIPTGTLGSWARRGTVDSYLEDNGGRKLRIVDLNDIRGRARELGRPLAPVAVARVAEVDQEPPSPAAPVLAPTERHPAGEQIETMIVPLDAWNKMLNQLGNLHEAGQQLAEARERAAKAETEASFLRERLAEMREVPTSAAAEIPLQESTEPWMPEAGELAGEPAPEPSTPRLWRYFTSAWNSRRR